MTSERLEALDSLRGIAALVVVINHSLNLFPAVGGGVAYPGPLLTWVLWSPLSLAWHGRGAVAIFFVLSGFVLALPWVGGRKLTHRAFMVRRVCRIYLPYAAAVAIAMLLASGLAPLRPASLSHWFDTANWVEPVSWSAILDHLFMTGGHNTFDNAVWSLNHEMRLSLIFPWLLIPVLRFGVLGAVPLAIGLYGLAGVITHFAGWHGAPAEVAATLRFATFFVLGALLATWTEAIRGMAPRHASLWGWLALAAGLLTLWAVVEPAGMAIGSGLIILAVTLPGAIGRTLGRPAPRALGRISYSLYLVHLPVILSAVCLLHDRLPTPVIAAGAAVASLPVAWLFCVLVEEPANDLGRRLTRRAATSA
jgi:peptidoglycan/LPS O-acetylase OafA/YrhL